VAFNKKLYPKNWKELRAAALERAGNRCACTGHCGSQHEGGRCGAPNKERILRRLSNKARWIPLALIASDAFIPDEDDLAEKAVLVVLTTAHLCRDKSCSDLTHLRSLCQRCHLLYDKPERVMRARETRRRNRAEAHGQGRLL
jgi:hypothetical protein